MSKTPENLLAIDSSTRRLRLALQFGSDRLVQSDNVMEKSHGQQIFKKIDELFQSAGMNVDQLEAVAVCLGPGSFTGLRIGLAAAKGMAVALDIPVVGVNLFELALLKLSKSELPANLILPHRRESVIMAQLDSDIDFDLVSTVQIKELSDIADKKMLHAIGLDIEDLPKDVQSEPGRLELIKYNGAQILQVASDKLLSQVRDTIALLEPLYLMKSQAEIRFGEREKQNRN